ncbi:hypothetical protein AVEN_59996-1 [Araneus ventricosus]|uniref:Histone-lysine N-methyltransferase SETMAR n=1 Tax=Araneus ventricosus TaxID=182803 RepID=A0A4Y2CCW1_ARAVE|nr:hypothetical protein AVEN_59996-1 [Araneus ventricosus]
MGFTRCQKADYFAKRQKCTTIFEKKDTLITGKFNVFNPLARWNFDRILTPETSTIHGPHTTIRTREFLDSFGWELFDHPPYSTDLAPSDFQLLPHVKTWLATQGFEDDEELHASVRAWLKSQAAKIYDDGVKKLVYRYDKCLNLYGVYVEK